MPFSEWGCPCSLRTRKAGERRTCLAVANNDNDRTRLTAPVAPWTRLAAAAPPGIASTVPPPPGIPSPPPGVVASAGWNRPAALSNPKPPHRLNSITVAGHHSSASKQVRRIRQRLKGQEGVQVDIIDRLPTPFGLVRSGVAPDHPETKIVVNQFSRVAVNPRYSFFGNVTLGSDVSLPELRKTYDVVVLAYGAESDRSFGIPGEDLRGIHSARKFVWWYNGHPDMCNLAPDLTNTDSAVVLGQEEMRNSRIKRRVYELLSKAATVHQENNDNDQKELHFVFFRKPTKFLPSEDGSTVGAVELKKTLLKDDVATGKQVAVGAGEFEDLNVGKMVLKSIGYKSLPVEGLSFDKYRGVVPNLRGRVLCSESETATVEPGLYVVGWLKRGPTGIVATNLHCAEETVDSILQDDRKGVFMDPSGPKRQGRRGLVEILEEKNARYVPLDGWEKIDSKEKTAGELKKKPGEKITRWNELLEAAREG
ncbi:adrenodoxin oxidoreductase, mitochondrial [Hordeum vulgare]|nr:adrenodoxin oxidoreductase, mitochondrial [Hordeum vulgare]